MSRSTGFMAALLCLPLAAAAQAPFVEGTHYQRIDGQQTRDTDEGIEVVEVFWYGCPSCFSFEPYLQRWAEGKPDDVVLRRIAGSMNRSWRVHARAFYTAEALGVLDRMHDAFYRALHIDRRRLDDGDALAAFFAEHGVDDAEFRRAYASFSVETNMRRGDQFVRRFRLTGVPSIVVAGKYRTDPGMAEGYERMIELIDHLVEMERRESAAAE